MSKGRFLKSFMEAITAANRESLLSIFIYLYLFIIYLSKPRLLTTNCCTNTRVKGSPSPTARNASVSCSVCRWWCKAFLAAFCWVWSSFPLLFSSNSQMTLRVFCAIQLTYFLNRVLRNKMWITYFWHHKTDFCSLSPVMLSLVMTAFASEKMPVFHFS